MVLEERVVRRSKYYGYTMGYNWLKYYLIVLHCFVHYEIDMLYLYTLQNVPTGNGVSRKYSSFTGHIKELDCITTNYFCISRKWWLEMCFVKLTNFWAAR